MYAAARRRGEADPLDHCALNVAVYGPSVGAWAFSEYPRARVARSPESFEVGGSRLRWEDGALVADVDERTALLGRRVRGRVLVRPTGGVGPMIELDREGRHVWQAIAPRAVAEVELESPRLSFRGSAYVDANWGSEPLEKGFSGWTWSRADTGAGTVVLYDLAPRSGAPRNLALTLPESGVAEPIEVPRAVELPHTRWGLRRSTRADAEGHVALLASLEDTPFYARSLVSTRLGGVATTAVHETLDLERFASRTVQLMLRLRMRRG